MKARSRSSLQMPLHGAVGTRSSAPPPFVVEQASQSSSAPVSLLPRAKLPEGHQTHPRVAFEYLKHLWAIGARREALSRLELLTAELIASLDEDGVALPASLMRRKEESVSDSNTNTRRNMIINGGGGDRAVGDRAVGGGGGTPLTSRRRSSLMFEQADGRLGLGVMPPLPPSSGANNGSGMTLPQPLGGQQPGKSLAGLRAVGGSNKSINGERGVLDGIVENGTSDDDDGDNPNPNPNHNPNHTSARNPNPVEGLKSNAGYLPATTKPPKEDLRMPSVGGRRKSLSGSSANKTKSNSSRTALLAVPWPQRKRLAVRCHLKLGEWLMALGGTPDAKSNTVRFEPMTPRFGAKTDAQGLEATMAKVLEYYEVAVQLDSGSYTAWHWWALSSFRAYEYFSRKQQHAKAIAAAATPAGGVGAGATQVGGGKVSRKTLNKKPVNGRKKFTLPSSAVSDSTDGPVVGSSAQSASNDAASDTPQLLAQQAIKGFFRSISLGRREGVNVLQDILRLLALWFANAQNTQVLDTIRNGLSTVAIDTWLEVIPQLIARVSRPGDLVSELLNRVGREHPQVLIYPLTVASKSDRLERAQAAHVVMATMRETHGALVDEAQVVSRELIRVAVLWPETWHKGLDEASSLYFTKNRNVPAMIEGKSG
jgi:hypothetical protein